MTDPSTFDSFQNVMARERVRSLGLQFMRVQNW